MVLAQDGSGLCVPRTVGATRAASRHACYRDGQPLLVVAEMQARAVGASPVEEAPACFVLDAPLEGIP
jgi:hypothetical protein